jgi:hypothetical protein
MYANCLNFEVRKGRYRLLILSEHLNTDFLFSSKKEGHELGAIPCQDVQEAVK